MHVAPQNQYNELIHGRFLGKNPDFLYHCRLRLHCTGRWYPTRVDIFLKKPHFPTVAFLPRERSDLLGKTDSSERSESERRRSVAFFPGEPTAIRFTNRYSVCDAAQRFCSFLWYHYNLFKKSFTQPAFSVMILTDSSGHIRRSINRKEKSNV